MTTYLRGSELIAMIAGTGMTRRDSPAVIPSDRIAIFDSTDERTVSTALQALIEQGYTLMLSRKDGHGKYNMTFANDDDGMPQVVTLIYVDALGRPPRMALCYVEDGRIKQYVKPYRWWVNDPDSEDAKAFRAEFDRAHPRALGHWFPILRGLSIVQL